MSSSICFITVTHFHSAARDFVTFKIGVHSTKAHNAAFSFAHFTKRAAHRHTLVCRRASDLFAQFAKTRDDVPKVSRKEPSWTISLPADTVIQRRGSAALWVVLRGHADFAGTQAPPFVADTREYAERECLLSVIMRNVIECELAKDGELAALRDVMRSVVASAAGEERDLLAADTALASTLRRICGLGVSESEHWLYPTPEQVQARWRIR
jgi:hypothetical protein